MGTPDHWRNHRYQLLEQVVHHPVREPVLVLSADLIVQVASRTFYSAFQLTPGETVGKRLADLANGQWNIPALLTLLNNLPPEDGEFDDFEMKHDFPALKNRTMLIGARRLSGRRDQGAMILLSICDITEQKMVAKSGVLGTREYPILSRIGKAVIVANPESHITFMNPTAERLTGWALEDAAGKHVQDIFHVISEQSSQTVENLIGSAIEEGTFVDLPDSAVLIAEDGGEWPIDANIAPIYDPAGRLINIVLVFCDISNRRETEQNLKVSEVRYRRLFEAAHDGILILDAVTSKVVDVNPFLCDLLGYPKEHFLGTELWQIGLFKDAAMSKKAMRTLQRVGRIRYDDLPLEHKDGSHIPVEFVSNVYREGRRNVIQCNIRDITERTLLYQALMRATLEAETANHSKSEFLANMSHEIRTPMGAILGFADMLLHKSPEECAQMGCVQTIQRNAAHLLELINDILDLSKVEAGQMKLECISCDLPELLSEIISLFRPRAVEKGLVFGVVFQGPIPRLIQSDPLRLRQILVNLLGNAIKFTESGQIDLRITDQGADGPAILLCVEVIDSGIGMTQEQSERLFRPFTQADASTTRKFGGTGLGLTISRRLAKLLNGDVTATSQPGIGSTFTLRVSGGPSAGVEQLQNLTEATLPPVVTLKEDEAHVHLRGRILLVEDGADNQRLLQMQLSDAGAIVTSAWNGKIAVDLAAAETFDLILMDMQMPVMDGYAAATELRRRGLTLPIIALTAHAMAEDRDKCLAAGCSGYLSKPIDEEKLLKTVHEQLGTDHLQVPYDKAERGIVRSLPPDLVDGSTPKRASTKLSSQPARPSKRSKQGVISDPSQPK